MMKKAFMFWLGAMNLTKDKAEKFMDELEERGDMSKEEIKKFVDEAIERGEEERQALKEMMKKQWNEYKDELPFVSRSDYEQLEARIKELESKLSQ